MNSLGHRASFSAYLAGLAIALFHINGVATSAAESVEPVRSNSSVGASQPNILVILADDLGWRDVGFHGSEVRTPVIDRIAREGVELDRFYVQPTCSPTRAGLMTGKSPKRLGIMRRIGKNETTGLSKSERILPQILG